MMAALEAARDALAACPTLVAAAAETPPKGSCRIGLEANISPASYPLVRVVPSRVTPGRPYQGRTIEALLYFGAPTTLSQGLESVYDDLATLEGEMLAVLQDIGGRYVETITDEDRLDAYKLMVIRCELPDPPATFVRCQINAASIEQALTGTPAALAPFSVLALEAAPADWTPNLAAGSISRLLNGATSTRTRIIVSGTVAGPVGASLFVGVYAAGALVGNRTAIITAGAGVPVLFSVQATHSASGSVAFDVRASGDSETFTFASLAVTGEAV
ncbi:MAG: hypothetical protein RLZZ524_3216 [Pseudomonadota bacterium]